MCIRDSCDTAGRLHNKKNLMDELSKISRVVHKACGTASVETLLVLDAITGQNAISQASQFIDAAGATEMCIRDRSRRARPRWRASPSGTISAIPPPTARLRALSLIHI